MCISHQDGHHSAVALLLKAALIQVSDYRLLGASGLSGVHAAKSLVSRVVLCRPLLSFIFRSLYLLPVLQIIAFDYPFGIFNFC
jgi:hypothetical protein